MTEISKKHEEEVREAISAREDLSTEIEQAMKKQPDEEVKVVRLFDDRYRCNWWVRDKSGQAMFLATSGMIRRSKFFKARRTADGVVIEEMGKRG